MKDGGPKPFCIFNGWFEHENFIFYARSCWSKFSFSGNKAFILKEKFKELKERLRTWNMEVFGCLDLSINSLVSDINSLDSALYDNWDNATVQLRNVVSDRFWKEIRLKESFLAQ